MGRGSTDQKSCEGFYIYLVLHFLSDNNPEKKKKKKENQISEEMFVKINAVSSTVLIVLMLLSFGKET